MVGRKILSYILEGSKLSALVVFVWILINSALDIYNDFNYEKAILKDSPFGGTPFLTDPKNYGSADGFIKSGEFVYVEDWVSAVNDKIIFAKVKSRLREGYINKELLVHTNINLMPILSVLILCIIIFFGSRKLYLKLSG